MVHAVFTKRKEREILKYLLSAVTDLCCNVCRYNAQQQLFLLFLLTLEFHPVFDARPCTNEGLVVGRLCHAAIINPSSTGSQQQDYLWDELGRWSDKY